MVQEVPLHTTISEGITYTIYADRLEIRSDQGMHRIIRFDTIMNESNYRNDGMRVAFGGVYSMYITMIPGRDTGRIYIVDHSNNDAILMPTTPISRASYEILRPILQEQIRIHGGHDYRAPAAVPAFAAPAFAVPAIPIAAAGPMYPNNGQRENRNIPAGSSNIITYDDIENGANMVNFGDEFGHGRYYTRATFDQLPINYRSGKKKHPLTRALIEPGTIRRYRARVQAPAPAAPAQGGRRRKTSKRRVSKKKKTHRRR
jgi:hypothetical protein